MKALQFVMLLGLLLVPLTDATDAPGAGDSPHSDALGELIVYEARMHRPWRGRCPPPRGYQGFSWWIEVYLPEHRLTYRLDTDAFRAVDRDTSMATIHGEPIFNDHSTLSLQKRPELTLTEDAETRLAARLACHLELSEPR